MHVWLQAKRNLSQLPNFALSIPLALFNTSSSAESAESHQQSSSVSTVGAGSQLSNDVDAKWQDADARLQDALLMFPNVLIPLMEKCQVTLDPVVMKHPYFNTHNLNRWVGT